MLKSLIGNHPKDKLVATYRLQPLLHSVLIEGKEPNGLCGPLEDRFYEFAYVGIADPTDTGTFRVGETCAEAILSRISHPGLPCVNPLKNSGPSFHPRGGGTTNSSAAAPRTLRDELLQVINLLGAFSTFHLSDGPARTLLQTLLADPTYNPFPHKAAIVNALVRSVMKNRGWPPLAQKIASLPDGRSWSFPGIAQALIKAEARYQEQLKNGRPVKIKPAGYYDDWVN